MTRIRRGNGAARYMARFLLDLSIPEDRALHAAFQPLIRTGQLSEALRNAAFKVLVSDKADKALIVRTYLRKTPGALESMTVKEVSDRTGVSGSTVHRVMAAMRKE